VFVRGVYRVVKEAMGGTLAKVSVSALLFDYVLTGPISAVSAGQYLAGFIEDIGRYAGHPVRLPFSAVFGVLVVLYFWWKNIQGIHESSDKAMKIMKITTVLVVILIVWCIVTLWKVPAKLPPNPFH
jgi:amino acid transporter